MEVDVDPVLVVEGVEAKHALELAGRGARSSEGDRARAAVSHQDAGFGGSVAGDHAAFWWCELCGENLDGGVGDVCAAGE